MEHQGFGPSYYAVITGPVLDDRVLSDKAKLLFAGITSMTDQKGYCWAGNKYLAERFGCGERTVSRLIAQLAERGFITYRMVQNAKTGQMERRIYIGSDAAEGVAKIGDTPRQNWRDGVAKNGEAIYMMNNKKKNNPPLPPEGQKPVESMFDRFWKAYPRKEAKKDARKAWDKLNPDLALCRVMAAALEEQKHSEQWQREGGRFIPLPATWLNGGRWEDEVRSVTEPPQPPEHDERRGRYL